MRSILASDAEARAAARGELRLVVRPVMPQPVQHGSEPMRPESRGDDRWVWMAYPESSIAFAAGDTRCPLGHPGDVVAVKETWTLPWTDDGPTDGVLYAADGEYVICAENRFTKAGVERSPWLSSARMRPEHVRSHLRVTRVEVRRVTTIGRVEGRDAGARASDGDDEFTAFRAEWDRRFAKRGAPFAEGTWAWFVGVDGAEVSR